VTRKLGVKLKTSSFSLLKSRLSGEAFGGSGSSDLKMPMNCLGCKTKHAANPLIGILTASQHISSGYFQDVLEALIAGSRTFFVEKFDSEKLPDFGRIYKIQY
jgi:hypothetical protein